jgi:hypothetical protein
MRLRQLSNSILENRESKKNKSGCSSAPGREGKRP